MVNRPSSPEKTTLLLRYNWQKEGIRIQLIQFDILGITALVYTSIEKTWVGDVHEARLRHPSSSFLCDSTIRDSEIKDRQTPQ